MPFQSDRAEIRPAARAQQAHAGAREHHGGRIGGVITRKVVEMANGGSIAAIRLVIDRLAPVCRDRPVDFELPPHNTPADAVAASAAIVAAVAAGDLTPLEAAQLSKVVHAYVQAVELRDFVPRMGMCEQPTQDKPDRNPG